MVRTWEEAWIVCVLCSGCSFAFEYNSVAASMKDTRGYLIIIYTCISNNS